MITSGRLCGSQCRTSSTMNDNPGAWLVATGPMAASLDVKRYALVMGQRAGPRIETDADEEILGESLLRDEVDDLVAAWRAQRPDLDVEPMQVLSRISRLARHLDIARRGAFAEHELESWEFDVLSALRRQGPPFQLTPGALLRATLVTSGTMTNRIDRLAAEGLVRREPDPRDKRGVLVTLTDQGQERVDAALAGLLRRERALLAGPGDAERRHPADPMPILLAPLLPPGQAPGAGPRLSTVPA